MIQFTNEHGNKTAIAVNKIMAIEYRDKNTTNILVGPRLWICVTESYELVLYRIETYFNELGE